ncbi:MAG: hypothetical protein AAGE61_19115 [Pseudomonadota bacterium]
MIRALSSRATAAAAIFAICIFASASSAQRPVVPTGSDIVEQRAFARNQLASVIRLYDEHLRIGMTGQYRDFARLNNELQESPRSSIASTGIGLISLTIGDRLGVIEGADEKAVITLANLLGKAGDSEFKPLRSKSGWYQHFIDGYTGEAIGGSKDVFSTIDTAILGVGAHYVASYFATLPGEKAKEAAELGRELVETINWSQAIRFDRNPGVHQVFRGPKELTEDRWWSLLFDEYVLLPCLGRAHEARLGHNGPATTFWNAYVDDGSNLPQTEFGNFTVLGPSATRHVSHFAPQFAFYFCGDLADKPAFVAELNELKAADKHFFSKLGEGAYPQRFWGLGAGSEIKFKKDAPEGEKIKDYSGYGVARIGKNPNHTFSPAIIAGFLPTESARTEKDGVINASAQDPGPSEIIANLMELHNRDECRYRHEDLDFLWRCSAHDPKLRVEAVEGIDLSTYMLGLSWFLPEIGPKFFSDHSVKTQDEGSEKVKNAQL